ncbi:hypothetical protein BJ742DRAFT_782882 [Cladochytrium replicatum]|nr:hypothetical protein BJ742DRAFT_782882 [Cladochytrium replicatum]
MKANWQQNDHWHFSFGERNSRFGDSYHTMATIRSSALCRLNRFDPSHPLWNRTKSLSHLYKIFSWISDLVINSIEGEHGHAISANHSRDMKIDFAGYPVAQTIPLPFEHSHHHGWGRSSPYLPHQRRDFVIAPIDELHLLANLPPGLSYAPSTDKAFISLMGRSFACGLPTVLRRGDIYRLF